MEAKLAPRKKDVGKKVVSRSQTKYFVVFLREDDSFIYAKKPLSYTNLTKYHKESPEDQNWSKIGSDVHHTMLCTSG